MRLLKFTSILILLVLAFVSCKSKEEKAAERIKTEMSKTLYDFDSYEPIETKVTEAYQTAYNDTSCLKMAMAIAYGLNEADKYLKDAKSAQERMDIWGPPTYYSSSYSNRKYNEYRDQVNDNMTKMTAAWAVIKVLGRSLQDSIAKLDDKKIVGWEVRHRFRCKTRGGHASIGDYRYIMSEDFKEILWQEDTDAEGYKTAKEMIETAIKGGLTAEE